MIGDRGMAVRNTNLALLNHSTVFNFIDN